MCQRISPGRERRRDDRLEAAASGDAQPAPSAGRGALAAWATESETLVCCGSAADGVNDELNVDGARQVRLRRASLSILFTRTLIHLSCRVVPAASASAVVRQALALRLKPPNSAIQRPASSRSTWNASPVGVVARHWPGVRLPLCLRAEDKIAPRGFRGEERA